MMRRQNDGMRELVAERLRVPRGARGSGEHPPARGAAPLRKRNEGVAMQRSAELQEMRKL